MGRSEENMNQPKRKWYRFLLNKYLIVTIAFIVWMIFFDQNSYLIHKELDNQIKELNYDKINFSQKLKSENEKIERMKSDTSEIEKVARERHFLKKEDEDIFVVEQKKVKTTAQNQK